MKPFILAMFVSLQAFAITDVVAWSPIDAYRSGDESFFACLWLTATNDDNQGEESEEDPEEEEEPDCD